MTRGGKLFSVNKEIKLRPIIYRKFPKDQADGWRKRWAGGLSPLDFDLFPKLKKPLRGKRFRSTEEVSNEVT
jgi:hypothetical protein